MAEDGRVTDFVEQYARDHDIDRELARFEDLRLHEGVVAAGPRLCLDDVSAIPFLSGIPGVELYQHRARVRAEDGDLFAAVTPTVDGYEAYCRDALKFGSARFVHAAEVGGPLEVARACADGDALDTIVQAAKDAGALTIYPYMGIDAVWDLAALVKQRAGVDVRVEAPVPAATWIANDKAALSEIVTGVLGDAFLVETYAHHDKTVLARRLGELAERGETIGLKRTRCASAMGNRTYASKAVRAMTPEARVELVADFFVDTSCAPGEVVLAVEWLETTCSPSTQLVIPAVGDPIVDGVYEQILTEHTRVFVGSRPSRLPPTVNDALAKASVAVARAFQRFGYVGRCSFDFLVVDPDGDFSIHFTECNGRWGGTSTPMHMVDRIVSGPRPPYRAQDVVSDQLVGARFSEVLERLGDDGQFVLYNVGPLQGSGKMDVIAFGTSPEDADRLMLEVLPERLGISFRE